MNSIIISGNIESRIKGHIIQKLILSKNMHLLPKFISFIGNIQFSDYFYIYYGTFQCKLNDEFEQLIFLRFQRATSRLIRIRNAENIDDLVKQVIWGAQSFESYMTSYTKSSIFPTFLDRFSRNVARSKRDTIIYSNLFFNLHQRAPQ